ncbi:hypothetical protein WSM22_12240 [Cytophagales bacterium WSM2-2]|nr:hypothetical protein WSM22_12240 [Cytophagales bacterium WSM2-2]
MNLHKNLSLAGALIIVTLISTKAQTNSVAIGSATADKDAVLMLVANGAQGLIIPKVDLSAAPTSFGKSGMVVYNTKDDKVYYYDGASSAWKTIGGIGGSAPTLTPNQLLANNGTTTTGIDVKGDLSLAVAGANGTFTVGKLQGVGVSTTTPTLNQVLQYNGSSWVPATIAGGTTFGNLTSTTTGLAITGGANAVAGATGATINIQNASATQPGLLTGTDWATFNGKLPNVLTTTGDIIFATGSTPTRLGVGTNGQILTVNGGVPSWQNAGPGFANPMTAAGDIIFGGAAGAATRLAGAAGFLKSTGATSPAWSSVNLASTDVTGTLPITAGGTGATTVAAALTNLGAVSNSLTAGRILVGNASNIATSVTMSGDGTINNTGALTIANGAISGGAGGKLSDGTIVDADVSTSAAIGGTKINPAFGSQNVTTTGTVTGGGGLNGGATNQFVVNGTGNITKINGVATSFPNTPGAVNTVLTNDGSGNLSWALTPQFSVLNSIPRGNGTGSIASSIMDNGTNVSVNGPINTSYRFLVSGANEAFAIDNTSIIVGDVLGNSFSNYFLTDFESTPRFAFIGANVGIGTTSPTTAKLVISGSSTGEGLDLASTDQYANLRVIRNSLNASDKDMYIGYQSGATSSLHLFSNNVETLTVKNNSVGIGTSNPGATLDIVSGLTGVNISANTFGVFSTATSGLGYGVRGINNASVAVGTGGETNGNGFGIFGVCNGGGDAGHFTGNVVASGTFTPSDEKLKTNIAKFESSGVSLLKGIEVKSYNYRQEGEFKSMNLPQGQSVGLLAGDLEKILPQLVKETVHFDPSKQNQTEDDLIHFKAVNYSGLVPFLIKAIQEQQETIDQQKIKIDALQEKLSKQEVTQFDLNALKVEIAAMKKALGIVASGQVKK